MNQSNLPLVIFITASYASEAFKHYAFDYLLKPVDVEELQAAIESTNFHTPACAIYQNVVAKAVIDKTEIKQNLIEQLTGAVRWTQSVQAMIRDGATKFTEVGPGKVLQGLIMKIDKTMTAEGVS